MNVLRIRTFHLGRVGNTLLLKGLYRIAGADQIVANKGHILWDKLIHEVQNLWKLCEAGENSENHANCPACKHIVFKFWSNNWNQLKLRCVNYEKMVNPFTIFSMLIYCLLLFWMDPKSYVVFFFKGWIQIS